MFELTASGPKAVLAVNFSAAEDPNQSSLATVSFWVEVDNSPMAYVAVVEGRHKKDCCREKGCQDTQQVMQPGLVQLALDVEWTAVKCLALATGYLDGERYLVQGRQGQDVR